MQDSKRRLWRELLLSFFIIVIALLIFFNRQTLLDQILLWQYHPDGQISQIAESTTLTGSGKRYFYVSRPQLLNKEEFNRYCPIDRERSIILGCYVSQRIYVYNVNDPRLPSVEEVTAAHEMLHAAYDRLGSKEKDHIDQLVKKTVDEITDERVKNLISLYEKTEPGELLNEMHSILATEVRTLPKELEDYYGRYFEDRQKVVTLSEAYESVFTSLEKQQKELISSIEALVKQINQRNKAFSESVNAFSKDVATFNAKAQSGGFTSEAEYNQERQTLIARQASLNGERVQINALISELDRQQAKLSDIAFQAASLNESIDSKSPADVPTVE